MNPPEQDANPANAFAGGQWPGFPFNANPFPPFPPPPPPPAPAPVPVLDYDHLSSLVSDQVVDRVMAGVNNQLAELIASQSGTDTGTGKRKKRRERCGPIQVRCKQKS
jgi:hypothetical protein